MATTAMSSPPVAAQAVADAATKPRGTNPLVDLLATEDTHVAALHALVHNIARAWSRSRPPPRVLDGMFRAVEGLSRAHRTFLTSLKAIGPRPASPKALGDLLMHWVDDLERPYHRFLSVYATPLDGLPGVVDNAKLASLLEQATGLLPSDSLDAAFALPLTRLAYYKRLYARLLRSTQPGRSDHRLLVAANGKLDTLLDQADQARQREPDAAATNVTPPPTSASAAAGAGADDRRTSNAPSSRSAVSATSSQAFASPPGSAAHSSASSMSPPSLQPSSRTGTSALKGTAQLPPANPLHNPSFAEQSGFPNPSPREESSQPAYPPSRQATVQPQSRPPDAPPPDLGNLGNLPHFGSLTLEPGPTPSVSSKNPASESPAALAARLQSELNTASTLDLFTLQPKACALHLSRPDLLFERRLRAATNVSVKLLPRPGSAAADGRGAEWPNAHAVLLTDLFLLAINMSPAQRAQQQAQGKSASRSLLFPPLTGKHLVLAPLPPQAQDVEALALTVLGKETLLLSFGPRCDPYAAENAALWRDQVQQCQQFASGLAGSRKPSTGPMNPNISPPRTSSLTGSASGSSSGSSPRGPPLAPLTLTPSINVDSSHGPASSPSPLQAHPLSGLPGSGSNSATDHGSTRDPRPESASTATSVASAQSFALANPNTTYPPNRLPSPQLPNSPMGPLSASPSPMSPIRTGQPITFNISHPGPQGPQRSGLAGAPSFPPQVGPMGPVAGPAGPAGLQPGVTYSPRIGSSPPGTAGGLSPSFPPSSARSAPSSPAVSAHVNRGVSGPVVGQHPLDPRRPAMPPRSASYSAGAPGGPGAGQSSAGPSTGSTSPANGVAMPSALLKSGQLAQQGLASRNEALAAASDQLLPGETPVTTSDDTATPGTGLKAARIVAQMRSKVFLRVGQGWKPLGQAQVQLYALVPKQGLRREHAARQLVAQGKSKTLISTLVLPDGGAHRMGRTGLAVECSHDGMRTGVVYLLQLRSEASADGLYAAIMEDAGQAP